MAIKPIVRYMLLCESWELDDSAHPRLTIHGLLSSIHSSGEPTFPVVFPGFYVFLLLTAGRGSGRGQIKCIYEETGTRIFRSFEQDFPIPRDPVEVFGVSFYLEDCYFPKAGMYLIQFWYEGELVEERTLLLR